MSAPGPSRQTGAVPGEEHSPALRPAYGEASAPGSRSRSRPRRGLGRTPAVGLGEPLRACGAAALGLVFASACVEWPGLGPPKRSRTACRVRHPRPNRRPAAAPARRLVARERVIGRSWPRSSNSGSKPGERSSVESGSRRSRAARAGREGSARRAAAATAPGSRDRPPRRPRRGPQSSLSSPPVRRRVHSDSSGASRPRGLPRHASLGAGGLVGRGGGLAECGWEAGRDRRL